MAESNFEVGQRVRSVEKGTRKIGTVKYIGPVQGYEGIWAGVDWDDGEGRHNGSVNGVRYFEAAGDKSASFVRLHSLSKGVTFLEALLRRYKGDATSQEEQDEMYVLSASQKRVSIQHVGVSKIQEKQMRLENLFHVSLEYTGVSSPGSMQEISGLLPKLEELDLRGNLLPDLHALGLICEQLPALRVLDISDSHMKIGSDLLPIFSNLRTLVLNNCGITWEQVEKLKKLLPTIEELHLGGNKLRTIEPSVEDTSFSSVSSPSTFVQGFDFLRLLSLEGNEIENWEEIVKLSQLSRLEQLHLSKNMLKHIFYPNYSALDQGSLNGIEPTNVCNKPFKNLHCVLLGGNKIEDLASVDALNNFPSLTEVRLSENPINDPTKGGASRYILIGRLSKILMLNGSEVKQRERKDSEIRYVRLVMTTMQGKSREEILQQHPRFYELKAIHDLPDENLSFGVTGPQKMAAGLISITLTYVGTTAGEKAPITKKLPATTTVGKLKMLCEGFFKLKPTKLRLFLKEEDTPFPTPLIDDMETLVDLGIGANGGFILIDDTDNKL
ncbi:hypothetical protein SUGI_0643060 [Cryptomeria japonica]|uniref:tubulin-folding cofactor E n=1 Tax=Cryptomeria japonica TaxID=3369 RepID=UPI0024146A9B|nr:tubulin-folding cofactor E [Cryptomeria japonica]GLJ31948.1 hypothetical protein SUGI_0643060 [Cryptomeria japonica]